MNKIAVFIDRDGTINEEVGYVDHFNKFRILPRVPEAIRKLNQQGIPAILVTNQSGVARGYFSLEFLDELHRKMVKRLEKEGGRLDGIYICPHHPDERCVCRKPRPGMLLKAAREHPVTLRQSYVIGDKMIDIRLAHSVGAKGILVLTGYGAEELRSTGLKSGETLTSRSFTMEDANPLSLRERDRLALSEVEGVRVGVLSSEKPDHITANLNEAVDWILKEISGHPRPFPPPPFLSKGRREGGLMSGQRRILIVKPSSLGDIIHSLPVLRSLRKRFPDASIGWVVKEVWKEILEGNPLLDEIIVLKKGVRGLLSAIGEVRRGRYETIIDLQGLSRSAIIAILSGARERIGFSNAREFAYLSYNRKVIVPPNHIHAVDRYLLTLGHLKNLEHGGDRFEIRPPEAQESRRDMDVPPIDALGSTQPDDRVTQSDDRRGFPTPPEKTRPVFPLYIEIEDSEWTRNFLLENGLYSVRPLIAINPSARWEKKRWPPHLYAALINQLIQEVKAGIIILGSEGDIPIAEEISSLVDGRAVIAVGKTSLKTLTALLDRVDLLVTNDSGPMHIAAALGRPVIALFGPTDPKLTGPYGDEHIVLRKEMECSPCFRRPCRHGRPLCMEAITVEEVMEAVKAKLS